MEKYNGIKVHYIHAAIPPVGISLNKTYIITVEKKKMYIMNNNQEQYFLTEELLKEMFKILD